jgi:exopolysaccharide biosynthesis polyprenyl glycosylphosphotransferase
LIFRRALNPGRPADARPDDTRAAVPDRRGTPTTVLGAVAKRSLDLFGAVVGLVFLSPVLLVIALAIRLDDRGPALFRQNRIGQHGRIFRIVKFRTMTVDADRQREELRARNEVDGAAFKLTDDPRVTRVGRFLRRFSLDELPQLWNVLLGEMSLVGPRPHPRDDVERYADWHFQRLSAKPGMTGLWQVSGRRDASFDRWVEQDIEYINAWSLWLDIMILFRTVGVVVSGNGR